MSQVLLGIIGNSGKEIKEINQIFAPGKTWADSTGLIYNVEEP